MPSISQLIHKQEPSTDGIKDLKLNDIVNAIGFCSYETMKDLGFAMGFPKGAIDQYVSSTYQNGVVSLRGITNMVFAWRNKTSAVDQERLLRKILFKVNLVAIADKHLPIETVTQVNRTNTILQESATQTVELNTTSAPKGQKQSVELLCLKCDRVIAMITNVINTKRSSITLKSKVRNIRGRECLVQLIETDPYDYRYDVITLTDADVGIHCEVFPYSGFDGYKEHRCTFCKGCSKQVGWYYIPADGSSAAPFYALWLQRLIHDSYDSVDSMNAFFALSQIKD